MRSLAFESRWGYFTYRPPDLHKLDTTCFIEGAVSTSASVCGFPNGTDPCIGYGRNECANAPDE